MIKHLQIMLFAIAALAMASACNVENGTATELDRAEEACATGNYSYATRLCDSIVARDHATLNADGLCRLALVYMRLSENGADSQDNAAMAAHCLQKAMDINADSTRIFLNKVPVEDLARVALLLAINEGHNNPTDADSLFFDEHVDIDNQNHTKH